VRLKVGLVAQKGLDRVKASVKNIDRRPIPAERKIGRTIAQPSPLRARLETLLDMVEDESGQFQRADDAEEFLITQLRSMGQEVLQEWMANEQH
jgi:hypothetical protein